MWRRQTQGPGLWPHGSGPGQKHLKTPHQECYPAAKKAGILSMLHRGWTLQTCGVKGAYHKGTDSV